MGYFNRFKLMHRPEVCQISYMIMSSFPIASPRDAESDKWLIPLKKPVQDRLLPNSSEAALLASIYILNAITLVLEARPVHTE